MKIKSLRMVNIRSYVDETVTFPDGIVLLSGSIGAGKSTILLAMEYALFGHQKGRSRSLLRRGEDSGSVELSFELDGSDIVVSRKIKHGNGMKQEECFISLANKEYSCTPTQLKAKILDMFGYPKDMLTKNIPIFRYTVYTPQEQMKAIMLDEEERLSALRKIFGVEKYENIRKNASIVSHHLHGESRLLLETCKDFEKKRERLAQCVTDENLLREETLKLKDELAEKTKRLNEEDSIVEELRMRAAEIAAMKQKTVLLESESARLSAMKSAILKEAEMNEARATKTREESAKMRLPESTSRAEIETEAGKIAEEKTMLFSKRAVIESDIRKLSGVKSNGKCPMCFREVSDPSHFTSLIGEKEQELAVVKNSIMPLEEREKALAKERDALRERELALQKMESMALAIKEYGESALRRRKESESLEEKISSMRREAAFARATVENNKGVEEDYKRHGSMIRELHAARLDVSSAMSRKEQALASLVSEKKELEQYVTEMRLKKEKASRMKEMADWVDTTLFGMAEAIERQVMNALQKEFSSIFQHWFSVLMPEEAMSVTIDETFSPVIRQNSHDASYDELSGGERTAVALAYRISLNKIINIMIDSVKTKGFLVLDEPTEGFSSEQLDRVRDVISSLGLEQVIIVSHEAKIDAFADNIIRIYKDNHVSRVE